ncbi:MAG: DUF3795 domain-containing protein [Methanotrichaceae archaeon]|nr:DUF3795 domain-containing protein [Methanotrichaceae archaeon]
MTEEIKGLAVGQAGPCGITCGSCPMGSGLAASDASRAREVIASCKIAEWAPLVPGAGGSEIDWDQVERGLIWVEENALCAGCEGGGGPPECPIRICAKDKGFSLCSDCSDLELCSKFDWLQGHGASLKEALKGSRGLSKDEYIQAMEGRSP